MTKTGKMPPQLLAHFKAKAEEKGEKGESSAEEKKEGDKEKRKEAVNKARIRMEESSRRKSSDKTQEAGKGSPKAS
jgi:hypothetical protein